MRKTLIAVIGAGRAAPHEEKAAREVGREIARRGAVLICGGLGGVMEAAAEGAGSVGGLTIGLLPGTDPAEAGPCMEIAIPTGLGEARNYLVATCAQGVIAIGGSLGTLSELAFALKKRLPVAALGTWAIEAERLPEDAVFHQAATPADAVEFVFKQISGKSC